MNKKLLVLGLLAGSLLASQAKAAPAVSNSTTDIACFQKALTIREDEIIKAWTERETAIGKAMETRKKALIAAFTKQTNVDRAKALVAAHTKFNTERLIINKNLTTKVDNSWNKFLKDKQKCKGSIPALNELNFSLNIAETGTEKTMKVENNKAGKSLFDLACIQVAVDKRETNILSAFANKTSNLIKNIEKRKAAYLKAYTASTRATRDKLVKEAIANFKADNAKVNNQYKTEVNNTWKIFTAERKKCRGENNIVHEKTTPTNKEIGL